MQLPETTQLHGRDAHGCFRELEQWAGILASSRSSETDPVLGARDIIGDKTVHAQRVGRKRAKTILFLGNRGQVVMNAVKKDEAREKAEGPEASLSREVAKTLSRLSCGRLGEGRSRQWASPAEDSQGRILAVSISPRR